MLRDIRTNYEQRELLKTDINHDPVLQFQQWMNEAIEKLVIEPTAMVLSTVDKDNHPHSRIVLLKDIMQGNFVFFTNYQSAKAAQLSTHKHAALNFFWPQLERQVRINGTVVKTSDKYSKEYFDTRPDDSKIGAWASPQSKVISSKEVLTKSFEKYQKKFKSKIPKPIGWGGYMLQPSHIEFWQGRPNRLHDRILYEKKEKKWNIYRLAP